MMQKYLFLFAGLNGLMSVLMGAFGAHALKGQLEPNLLGAFETAVQYQMSHSLILLITCLLMNQWRKSGTLKYAAYAFCIGITLFCGSLYLLALTNQHWPGPITPLGGLSFIIGWCLLCISFWNSAEPTVGEDTS